MAGPGHRSAGKPLLVKIVMAGESCVGKTSIVRTYTEPSPAGPPRAASYLATVGIDFKVKTITFNDTTVKLQIWDTAGQEQFHTISTSYFRGARGFVLVYDITNSDSFQGITSWMKDIHQKADDEVDIVLLGNKCDKETERVIPKHRGEKLAWEYGIPFFETSATDNINIEDAFSLLVKEILDKIQLQHLEKPMKKLIILPPVQDLNGMKYLIHGSTYYMIEYKKKSQLVLIQRALPWTLNVAEGLVEKIDIFQSFSGPGPCFEFHDAYSLKENSYILCDLDVVDLNESKKKRTCCQL